MTTLNILTPRGQQTLRDEADAAAIFERCTGLSYVRTPDHLPSRVDALLIKEGRIAGVVETKCRYDMTRASLRDEFKNEWLVSMHKIESLKAASASLCVPAFGFLYIVRDGLLLVQRITDEAGEYAIPFRVDRKETQKNCNGGTKKEPNAFFSMANAPEYK